MSVNHCTRAFENRLPLSTEIPQSKQAKCKHVDVLFIVQFAN